MANPRRPMESARRPVRKYHREAYDQLSLDKSGFSGVGKTVLITGGSTGIGFSIAEAFVRANVQRLILVNRSTDKLETAKEILSAISPSVEIVLCSVSVTDHDEMTAILHQTGHIDVLVLNAVMVSDATPMSNIQTSVAREVFETNVISTYHLVRTYLASETPGNRSKTLINVSSAAAGFMFPLTSVYAASKAAVVSLLQHFHSEQQSAPLSKRARIFSFHPGMIYTPLVAQHVAPDWVDFEDVHLPANFAVWLAGSKSDILQGRFVWAQWDVDELLSHKERFDDSTYLTIGLIQ